MALIVALLFAMGAEAIAAPGSANQTGEATQPDAVESVAALSAVTMNEGETPEEPEEEPEEEEEEEVEDPNVIDLSAYTFDEIIKQISCRAENGKKHYLFLPSRLWGLSPLTPAQHK